MWAGAGESLQPPASARWSLTSRHSSPHAIESPEKIYTIKPAAVPETIYTLQPNPTAPQARAALTSDATVPPQLPSGIFEAPLPLPLLHANGAVGPVPPPRFAISPRAHSLLDHSNAATAAVAAALPALASLSSAVAQAAPAHANVHAPVHAHSRARPGSPSHFSYAGAVLSRFPPRTQAAAQSFGVSPMLLEPRAYTPAAARAGFLPPELPQPSFTAHTRATSHPHPRDRPSYDPHRATQQHQPARDRRQRSAQAPPASRLGSFSHRSAHPLPHRRPRARGASTSGSGYGQAAAILGASDPGVVYSSSASLRSGVDVDALEQWVFVQDSQRAQPASQEPLPPKQGQHGQRHAQGQKGEDSRTPPPHHTASASAGGLTTATQGPADTSSVLTAMDHAAGEEGEEEEESPLQRWRRLQAANRAAQTEAARRAVESRQKGVEAVAT